ncbi:hypothetical protein [Neisseria sp. Ec49-e6-T10]|uniref:hypothetical protein n=1 Tax=Neisseria sp. Ec49-e6-T10 TaxID=3140744 RepID=UPI003EBC2E1A
MNIHSIRSTLSTEFVVYSELRQLCDNHEPTLRMLSKFLYWAENVESKAPHRDGWFWKTGKDLASEIGVTRRGYEVARTYLTNLGVLDFKKGGIFNKMHFRVNAEKLLKLVYQVKGLPIPKDINEYQLDNDGFRVPNWMPIKLWNQFIGMRQRKKGRTMLNIDKKKRINELKALRDQKLDIHLIMEETIIKGWAAFYQPNFSPVAKTLTVPVTQEQINAEIKAARELKGTRSTKETAQENLKNILSNILKN